MKRKTHRGAGWDEDIRLLYPDPESDAGRENRFLQVSQSMR